MAGRSLRAQLNQIRAWVREGRTDAWIAHQLEVPASELRDFRRRHDLAAESEPEAPDDLRDEIEAEIEAEVEAEAEAEEAEEEAEEAKEAEAEAEEAEEAKERRGEGEGRRRRRRRGGRGRRRGRPLEATFDHGEKEGYGLWLDASVKDNPVYDEHWAGHREVEVTIEPDQIVIRRSGRD